MTKSGKHTYKKEELNINREFFFFDNIFFISNTFDTPLILSQIPN